MLDVAHALELDQVRKTYGDPAHGYHALTGASFHVKDNEFFTLLGPSGSGKTTLLRLLAGFEATTSGEIRLYGKPIQSLVAEQRPVNTVFQQYSLFPHMTIAQNVGFGLKMQGKPAREISARVEEMLALVKMEAFHNRLPAQLSGGQQQRVALARSGPETQGPASGRAAFGAGSQAAAGHAAGTQAASGENRHHLRLCHP